MVHTNLGNSHVVIDGQFVSAKISRVVEAIKDYEPRLNVEWVPPAARTEGQAAFKITYTPDDLHVQTLFYVKNEEDFDERVLLRIIQNDQRHSPVGYTELEAFDKMNELIAKQKWLDELEEAADVAYHVFKSHKNTYVVDKDLVIKEGIPFNAKNLKD